MSPPPSADKTLSLSRLHSATERPLAPPTTPGDTLSPSQTPTSVPKSGVCLLHSAAQTFGTLPVVHLSRPPPFSPRQDSHEAPVTSLDFSDTEPVLLSGSTDNSLKQWLMEEPGATVRLLRYRCGHALPPTCVLHYGPDGRQILSAGQDLSLRVFSTVQDQQSVEMSQKHIAHRAKKQKVRFAHVARGGVRVHTRRRPTVCHPVPRKARLMYASISHAALRGQHSHGHHAHERSGSVDGAAGERAVAEAATRDGDGGATPAHNFAPCGLYCGWLAVIANRPLRLTRLVGGVCTAGVHHPRARLGQRGDGAPRPPGGVRVVAADQGAGAAQAHPAHARGTPCGDGDCGGHQPMWQHSTGKSYAG